MFFLLFISTNIQMLDSPIIDGAALFIAYLIGSIPFGYLIVKLKSGADIRQTGSGATGATNVTRKAGKVAGIVTLALDALKGAVAVWLVSRYKLELAPWAGLLAIIGHCFPVWLRFKAGKGVATGLGVFLVLAPWAVLAALIVFLLVVWRTRFISLGSILAAVVIPLALIAQHLWLAPSPNFGELLAAVCIASTIIIAKHHENIRRLLAGNENRFGAAKS